MHICCCIDDNYAQHCGVLLCSIFENNKNEKFEIHLLIKHLNNTNKENLNKLIESYGSICHFHIVDGEKVKGVKFRAYRPVTEAAYYRVLLASILDNSISKVLYLDSDTIVTGDITPLFSLNLDGYALAATQDIAIIKDEHRRQIGLPYNHPYFCSGVMLINLDYWRKNNSEKDLLKFSKKNRRVFFHDQDALNAVFNSNWLVLSPKWNRFYPYIYKNSFFENILDKNEFENNPVIIHYFYHFKPWNKIYWFTNLWVRYRGYYYKYLSMTPWRKFNPLDVKVHKFGLYKYLVIYSFKYFMKRLGRFIYNDLGNALIYVLLFPLRVFFQIPYRLNKLKK